MTVTSLGTNFSAIFAQVAREAETSAVHGIAIGIILAGANRLTSPAERISRTGSGARLTVKSCFTGTVSSPRMTKLSVIGRAGAYLSASRTVELIRAGSLRAVCSSPSFFTGAGTVRDVAYGTVPALALVLAVLAVHSGWALLLTLIPSIAGKAEASSVDVIAAGVVVTGAAQRALRTPGSIRARIGADVPRPSVRAETFAVDGRACAAVLAPAGRGAALTVRPIRTRIVAQWSIPAWLAGARSGYRIARGLITTLTLLEAGLTVGAFGAARVAVETFPSARASTGSVDRIAFRSI